MDVVGDASASRALLVRLHGRSSSSLSLFFSLSYAAAVRVAAVGHDAVDANAAVAPIDCCAVDELEE